MNFNFDLNFIIPYEITKFNSDLRIIHPSYINEDERAHQLNRDMMQKLSHIIDKMGEASAKAQGLKEIITSCRKLSIHYEHRIYLMKDANDNNGIGSVVGMLKVGEKHLFVHDMHGKTHEMHPLCVLDFFVCERQQRKGYGRKLFDFMLFMENIRPELLAVDMPSEKSVNFLKKHYNLRNPIPQVNNFVVFDGFFENPNYQQKRNTRHPNTNMLNNRKNDISSANPAYNRSDLPLIANDNRNNRIGSVDPRLYNKNEASANQKLYINRNNSFTSPNIQTNNNATNDLLHNFFNSSSMSKLTTHSTPPQFLTNSKPPTPLNNNHTSPLLPNLTPDNSTTNNNNNNFFHKKPTVNNGVDQYATNLYNFDMSQFKYNPFPSLNPSVLNKNSLAQKPPLPFTDKEKLNSNVKRDVLIENKNREANNRINNTNNDLFNNNNNNMYCPFPSLNSVKTSPDFHTNQAFITEKYRKTRLW